MLSAKRTFDGDLILFDLGSRINHSEECGEYPTKVPFHRTSWPLPPLSLGFICTYAAHPYILRFARLIFFLFAFSSGVATPMPSCGILFFR